jgi:hypothetical protein
MDRYKKIILFYLCFSVGSVLAKQSQSSLHHLVEKIKNNKEIVAFVCSVSIVLNIPVLYYLIKKRPIDIEDKRSSHHTPTPSVTLDLGSIDHISVKTSDSTTSFPLAEFRLRYSSLTQKSALQVAKLLRHISLLPAEKQEGLMSRFVAMLDGTPAFGYEREEIFQS